MSDPRAAAFARVYRAEYGTVVAYCQHRVDDVELARDLAAEVFRAVWQRWDEPRSSDRAWLLGVARHLVVDEYRRRNRRHGATVDLERAAELPDPRAAADFEHADVRRALSSLQADEQELLRLHYWDDVPAADVAALLDISVGAVWVRLTRARRAFATAWAGEPRAPRATAAEGNAR